MSEEYDLLEDEDKKQLEVAENTGFLGDKFIYDRNNQLCLRSFQWLDAGDLGIQRCC